MSHVPATTQHNAILIICPIALEGVVMGQLFRLGVFSPVSISAAVRLAQRTEPAATAVARQRGTSVVV